MIELEYAGVYQMEEYKESGGVMCRMARMREHHCVACDCMHTTDNAYVVRKSGSFQLRCFKCSTPIMVWKYEETEEDEKEVNPLEELPPMDQHDKLLKNPHDSAEVVNSRYNTDAITDDIDQDLYLAAPCKSGKNYYVKQVINKLPPKTTIMALSARVVYGVQVSQDLELENYQNIKGEINADKHPRVMVQLESLKRVDESGYDVLILDELTALQAHMFQNDQNVMIGYSIMKAIQSCKRLIVMCADLTKVQIDACEKVRGKKGRTIINQFQAWVNTKVMFHRGEGADEHVRGLLFNFLDAEHEKKKQGEEFNGCMVPCHSLKTCRALHEKAVQLYGADSVAIYNSDTGDDVKKKDFVDTIAAWSDKLAVFSTSTLSVGVDFNNAHMTDVFGFMNNRYSNSNESVQQLYRARQVKNMNVSFSGSKTYLPTDQAGILEWMTTADKHRKNIPLAFSSNPLIPPELNPKTNANDLHEVLKNWSGRMWVDQTVKKHRNARYMIEEMISSMERDGCDVEVHDMIKTETTKPATDLKKFMKISQEKHYDAVANATLVAIKNGISGEKLDSLQNNNNKTATDKCELKGSFMLMNLLDIDQVREFKKLEEAEASKWVEHHDKTGDKYKEFKKYMGYDANDFDISAKLTTAHDREKHNILNCIYDALKINPNEINPVIKFDTLMSDEVIKINQHIEKVALRVFGDKGKCRRAKLQNKVKQSAATLSVALKFIGASLSMPTDRKRAGTYYNLSYAWNNEKAQALMIIPLHPQDKRVKYNATQQNEDDGGDMKAIDYDTDALDSIFMEYECDAIAKVPKVKHVSIVNKQAAELNMTREEFLKYNYTQSELSAKR
jgi:hypothetical protein